MTIWWKPKKWERKNKPTKKEAHKKAIRKSTPNKGNSLKKTMDMDHSQNNTEAHQGESKQLWKTNKNNEDERNEIKKEMLLAHKY